MQPRHISHWLHGIGRVVESEGLQGISGACREPEAPTEGAAHEREKGGGKKRVVESFWKAAADQSVFIPGRESGWRCHSLPDAADG